MKKVAILLVVWAALTVSCTEDAPPKLYATISNFAFDDFVYTNNGYLLMFKNFDRNESNFTLQLKSDDINKQPQPVFPLSHKDTIFASNLIYALVEKEGESWLLFDKTFDKNSEQKRYKLTRYDFLRRAAEKSYTVVPIQGRDFVNAIDLQIDDKKEMMFYFDKSKNDFVAINLKDGTFKTFTFPMPTINPIVGAFIPEKNIEKGFKWNFKLILNKNASVLYLINLTTGKLFSIEESYLINKQFFSKDVQTQIILEESGLENVVDIDFDEKNRPIIATSGSIYLIRKNDKIELLKNFMYGDISSISYANKKIFFNAKTKKNNIFYIDM